MPEVNAIKKELEEFVHAVTNNHKTIVSELDGLMAMEVAHQILEKIGNNLQVHGAEWQNIRTHPGLLLISRSSVNWPAAKSTLTSSRWQRTTTCG